MLVILRSLLVRAIVNVPPVVLAFFDADLGSNGFIELDLATII